VAASLLHALGLNELITSNLEEYEQQALYLLADPSVLNKIRKRLWRARTKTDVFDGKAFARKLETAYHQIWQRYWP
jgi:predicted O-linked N-acetylglucosamine transferase (SPINDLY family)